MAFPSDPTQPGPPMPGANPNPIFPSPPYGTPDPSGNGAAVLYDPNVLSSMLGPSGTNQPTVGLGSSDAATSMAYSLDDPDGIDERARQALGDENYTNLSKLIRSRPVSPSPDPAQLWTLDPTTPEFRRAGLVAALQSLRSNGSSGAALTPVLSPFRRDAMVAVLRAMSSANPADAPALIAQTAARLMPSQWGLTGDPRTPDMNSPAVNYSGDAGRLVGSRALGAAATNGEDGFGTPRPTSLSVPLNGQGPYDVSLDRDGSLDGPMTSGQTQPTAPSFPLADNAQLAPLRSRALAAGPASRPSETGIPNNAVDWSFIATSEGGQHTDGYIPKVNDLTGVTTATGVDLGSVTAADLANWGASKSLIARLTPYLGLQGSRARALLNDPNNINSGLRSPLSLSPSEAALLTAGAKSRALNELSAAYNAASGRNFYSLSPPQQTVLADVAFQTGQNGLEHHFADGAFWNYVVKGDWTSAKRTLSTMQSQYKSRRTREANLL
jgi:hypothetical protein